MNKNVLTFSDPKWEIPFTFMNRHSYVIPSVNSIYFTRRELQKLHTQFEHPNIERLFQTLRRADAKISPPIKETLNDIVNSFDLFCEFHSPPFRFRASLPPDKILFNLELSMDRIWLDGKPVLHILDKHTGYQNSMILKDKTYESLWDHFLVCSATLYARYPKRKRLYQERSFWLITFVILRITGHRTTVKWGGNP